MTLYLLIVIGLLISSFIFRRFKHGDKYFLILTFIVLVLVSGLRNYMVGSDTEQYVNFFQKVKDYNFNELSIFRFEIGFSVLCKIITSFTSDYHIFLLLISAFCHFCILRFVRKNSTNIYLSSLLYILCNFFFDSMNVMRVWIALGLILVGYEYLKDKKFIRYSIFVIVAAFFHLTALAALVAILFRIIKFDKKKIGIIFVLSALLFIYGKDIYEVASSILPRLSIYTDSSWSNENTFGAFFIFLVLISQLIFGLICIYRKEKNKRNELLRECIYRKEKNKRNELLREYGLVLGMVSVACLLSILGMKATILNRILPFFSIFTIIWTPNCLDLITDRKIKLAVNNIIVMVFLAYFMTIGILRPEWYNVSPYIFMDNSASMGVLYG